MLKPRFQVRFILLWIMPYVAMIAVVLGGSQTQLAKVQAILGVTFSWTVARFITCALKRRRERLRIDGSRHQFGIPTMLGAIALVSLWFGWAEVVRDIAERGTATDAAMDATPAVVFQPR
jgi:hypothetical protein